MENQLQDATVCKHHYTLNYPSEHQNVVEAYKDVQHLMLRGYMCVQLAQMIMALRDRGLLRRPLATIES